MEHNLSSSRTDRKLIERNRRNQMKELYSQLNSLVPHQSSRVSLSLSLSLSLFTRYCCVLYNMKALLVMIFLALIFSLLFFSFFIMGIAVQEPVLSVPDQLDEAASYIKRLQTNLEKMKEKKDSLMGMERADYTCKNSSGGKTAGLRSPQIEVSEMGSTLEVVLMNGLDSRFMFNEIIRVLHEEGAEIINASLSVVEDTVFHTIHSKVYQLPS